MPKAKSKTKKKSTDSKVEAKSKEQLWEECLHLQQQLHTVRSEEKQYKMERDMAQMSWDKAKINLEKAKASKREKLQVKQEMTIRHQKEIREWEQKLKAVQTAHKHEITELKMDNFARRSDAMVEQVTSEFQRLKMTLELQADKTEKEAAAQALINQIKLRHQNDLEALNISYDLKAREIEVCCEKKIKAMIEEHVTKTQTEVDEIDAINAKRAESLVEEIDCAYRTAKQALKHDAAIQLDNRRLKRELKEAKRYDRKWREAEQEMQRLMDRLKCLRERRQQLPDKVTAIVNNMEWRKDLSGLITDKGLDLFEKYLDLKAVLSELDHIRIENDEYLEVYGESGLEGLERMIEASAVCNQEESLRVWLALVCGRGDKTAAKKIEDLYKSKRVTFKALKKDLCRLLKEYDELVKKAVAERKPHTLCLPRSEIEKYMRNASIHKMQEVFKVFEAMIKKGKDTEASTSQELPTQSSAAL